MANQTLFNSIRGKLTKTTAVNEAGAPAYAFAPKHKLAQYAITGCLNDTFYADAEAQLATVLELCEAVEAEFIAKTAVYCREKGFMKDMPALLTAVLSVKDRALFDRVFDRTIDNGKMLRTVVQVLRSGVVGRKSLGTLPKRKVRGWFEKRDEATIFRESVGQSPSLADIVKMVHPKPATPEREAFFGYLLDKAHDADRLPETVRRFEAFKAGDRSTVPVVPFQMLTALDLGTAEWVEIAKTAGWQMTRMNLNTFARHGVFAVPGMTKLIAKRLTDEEAVKKARVFPYQLLAASLNTGNDVPGLVREALRVAMEIAVANVPRVEGRVVVLPDVSGSMHSAATGRRAGATSAVRCIDVAALVAAAVLRKNPSAQVIPFEQEVVKISLNGRDSIMTNAEKLAAIGGGGTNCSAPLAKLNADRAKADLVIYVSDNESWVDAGTGRNTATQAEWNKFKARNPNAKLVCIDIQPYGTTQAAEREDILNIGGFSDQVFTVIAEFAAGKLNPNRWVGKIEEVVV